MAGTFEVYEDRAGEFRFRFKVSSGIQIGVSEGYQTKSGVANGIESVRKNASQEKRYELKESKGKWYFNLKAKNGQIIMNSKQGYSTKEEAQECIKSVVNDIEDASEIMM